jgi:DNA mismatch endonuclease (patch repair protein)
MTDVLTTKQRSFCMSRIRARDTAPEKLLRKALWRAGMRYRLKTGLAGRPDIVLRRFKTVVFVDGCFWHRCPEHGVAPKTNGQFWAAKLAKNVARDKAVTRALAKAGWRVIRIWEHEVECDAGAAARTVIKAIGRRVSPNTGGAARR